jgi:hypothetical protein
MSAGLPVPKQVFSHGFLLNRGQKESKSLGNVTDPMELAEQFGVDPLRYFLMREIAFGQDGSYSPEAIVTRCNAELANSFGNLAQRVLSMIFKNLRWQLALRFGDEATDADTALRSSGSTNRSDADQAFDEWRFSSGIESWMQAACSPATSMSMNRRPGRCARPIPSGWRSADDLFRCRAAIWPSPSLRWCRPRRDRCLTRWAFPPKRALCRAWKTAIGTSLAGQRISPCAAGPACFPRLELPADERPDADRFALSP